jgi:hypothetical protein
MSAICSQFAYLLVLAVLLTGCAGGGSNVSETGTSADTRGVVMLSWTPVKDGNIAGYNIRYGIIEGQYPHKISVPDSDAESYVIKGLSAGTYYFVVTSYDKSGNESEYSEVARKTVK